MTEKARHSTFRMCYWLVVVILLGATTAMLFTYTPKEKDMGEIQKVFYVHLPAAINTFLGCLVAFVGAIGYLWRRRMAWDSLSAAGAKVAALMSSVVLITGMIWAKPAWGAWWIWTPRLTFSLVLWLMYVVYMVVRPSIEQHQRRAMICAVYALVSFLNVPLVYLSARLLPDIHPASVKLAAPMKLTLAAWFVPVTLITVGLMAELFHCNMLAQQEEADIPEDAQWDVPRTEEDGTPSGDGSDASGSQTT